MRKRNQCLIESQSNFSKCLHFNAYSITYVNFCLAVCVSLIMLLCCIAYSFFFRKRIVLGRPVTNKYHCFVSGPYFASAGDDIKVWDSSNLQIIEHYNFHEGKVKDLSWSSDNNVSRSIQY